ncbi:hypothetical protein AZ030_002101, partial [Escherichia coli]
ADRVGFISNFKLFIDSKIWYYRCCYFNVSD